MRQIKLLSMFVLIALTTLVACQKDDLEAGEGQGGELGESGKQWARSATASEIVNGVKLILTFDENSQTFTGTLENLNTKVAPQVRVEVHVYDAAGNSIEYGPTTPGDMQPSEKRNVSLPAPNAGSFIKFAMHPEIAGGEGSGGGESGEGNHGENGNG
ncbi:hypothetical protein EMN47_20015 [Prolixibacteraceae bacterium JC049]|nr:hypothetical protein [Prolixibacteraceae bacterium JC049]